MNAEYLVKMANEIAAFYAADSSDAEVAKDIASHLTRFWEPRMRKVIIEHNKNGGAGLKDAARQAVELLTPP
jgi:formate dehydrogenase subunit delta